MFRYKVKLHHESVQTHNPLFKPADQADANGFLYGIICEHGETAEQVAALDCSLVEDIVLPCQWIAPKEAVVDVVAFEDGYNSPLGGELLVELGFAKSNNAYKHPDLQFPWIAPFVQDDADLHQQRKFVEAELLSASLGRDKLRKGQLFSTHVGDGSAHYVVSRVHRAVCVSLRFFQPDRWVDRVLGGGGSFPRRTIERLVGVKLPV